MDNKKRIRDLTNTSVAPENTDFLALDNGTTNKITRENLLAGTPLPADTVDTQAIENDAVTTNKVADEAVTPAKRSGGLKTGVFNINSSSGLQSITGVGFKPRLVNFTLLPPFASTSMQLANGSMDENGNQFASGGSATFATNTASRRSMANRCIILHGASDTSSASTMEASYESMDSDGFTLNINTGHTVSVGYEAYA